MKIPHNQFHVQGGYGVLPGSCPVLGATHTYGSLTIRCQDIILVCLFFTGLLATTSADGSCKIWSTADFTERNTLRRALIRNGFGLCFLQWFTIRNNWWVMWINISTECFCIRGDILHCLLVLDECTFPYSKPGCKWYGLKMICDQNKKSHSSFLLLLFFLACGIHNHTYIKSRDVQLKHQLSHIAIGYNQLATLQLLMYSNYNIFDSYNLLFSSIINCWYK